MIQPSPIHDPLALMAQTYPIPYPQFNHEFVQQQHSFAYPQISNQPNVTQQPPLNNPVISYGNLDTMYYAQTMDDPEMHLIA